MSEMIEAVEIASSKWKAAFNDGNANACAACYEPNAIMVAKPFGIFRGRAEIEAFWANLIEEGFSDVEYIAPELQPLGRTAARLTSGWRMNKASGTISKEIWVMQLNGEALLREDHFEVTA